MRKKLILIGENHNSEEKSNKMKIVFMQMHIPDPRTNKRITVAKKLGKVSVICVRRATQDIWEPAHSDVPHYTFPLNIPTSRELVKRFFVSRYFSHLAYRKLLEIRPDIIYCGSIDTLAIACKYKKKYSCRIYFEVADLRECFIQKPKLLKEQIEKMGINLLEKKYFGELEALALTSMAFYEAHYKMLISKNKVIYVPNTPDISVFKNYKHKEDGNFTVGFIGGIRYLEQMKLLVDAAGEVGCKVLFAGAGGTSNDFENISDYCIGKEWVTFTGKYDYVSQIADLYGRVDCVYAVYDADNPNVRIALPNKLYEAVYCELPIIVAKRTYLSKIVAKYNIGVCMDHKCKDELCNVLNKLMDKSVYKKIRDNCARNKYELVNDEWTKLLESSFSKFKR